MQSDPGLFDEPHPESLEVLSARALARKDFRSAFEFADRRCRLKPPPGSRSFVLRAEAFFWLGRKAAAIGDLAQALRISPDDLPANRRMLVWAKGDEQIRAAHSLIASDQDFKVLQAAISLLKRHGQQAFASAKVLDDFIQGWAAWRSDARLEFSIFTSSKLLAKSFLERDPSHPLSSKRQHATNFYLPRPRSAQPLSVSLSIRGERLFFFSAPANDAISSAQNVFIAPLGQEPCTVIVPVYADFDATYGCLESLIGGLKAGSRHRIVIVNDASPEPRIDAYLEQLRKKSRVRLLANTENLGFVGSINRALAEIDGGDVILLNSDTVVPPEFVERLERIARSSPQIGTITPLSNNGEFMSFPVPNEVNALGSLESIAMLDGIAAHVNSHKLVDIPNGIGFCLYITRACLNAVGGLSERFHRGYLEDVDFCLQARELGFRNVCAPSVYVGHAGSRSFGHEKRSLVLRNLQVLDSRFPNYRAECSAFALADPLALARQAIERSLPSAASSPILLVTGAGAIRAIARARASQLRREGHDALILEVRNRSDGGYIRIYDPGGAIPQSIQFSLSSRAELDALKKYLKRINPSRVELLDPSNASRSLVEILKQRHLPHDLFIADGGLFWPPETPVSSGLSELPQHAVRWRRSMRPLVDGADRIFVPDPLARAMAVRFLSEKNIAKLAEPWPQAFSRRPPAMGDKSRLGIIPIRGTGEEFALIRAIAREFKANAPQASIVVFGETQADLALMRFGNVFVTGPVEIEEIDRLLGHYKPGYILAGFGQPLFGHPLNRAATLSGIPTAFFDWSMGQLKSNKRMFPLDPFDRNIGRALREWISR